MFTIPKQNTVSRTQLSCTIDGCKYRSYIWRIDEEMQEAFDPISEACWGPGWWWPWGAEQWGMQMTTTQKKRWLMVITVLSCLNYILLYYSQDCSAAESTKDAPKDRTTLVVFIGLLIDLLGEKKLSKWPQCAICSFFSAFTLILPLFPALIGHYRENDSSGLFAYLETKVLLKFQAGL